MLAWADGAAGAGGRGGAGRGAAAAARRRAGRAGGAAGASGSRWSRWRWAWPTTSSSGGATWRGLRMTREEVKRESKESEGDPSHRAERQRLHRELMEQRMVAEVRKADFVVVNPDHIAVALRYDRDGDAAPVVVASGERLLAERIKQVAREAGVPIFRDVTLARSLRDLPEGAGDPGRALRGGGGGIAGRLLR